MTLQVQRRFCFLLFFVSEKQKKKVVGGEGVDRNKKYAQKNNVFKVVCEFEACRRTKIYPFIAYFELSF